MTFKYTIELTNEQNEQLESFKTVLRASTKADVLRRALGLAALMVDVHNRGKKLAVVSGDKNEIEEVIRLL